MLSVAMLAPGCLQSDSDPPPSAADPQAAARTSLAVWSAARGGALRDYSTVLQHTEAGYALVHVSASVWDDDRRNAETIEFDLPVESDTRGGWRMPSIRLVGKLVQAARAAESISAAAALDRPTPTPEAATIDATPAATASLLDVPPPPPGTVIYESDWSAGLDGWIGTPDWRAGAGALINDGSRAGGDPWIEAPVRVDAWQPMVIEFNLEVRSADFGSFGLVARAGQAGWFRLGARREPADQDTGDVVAIIAAEIRQEIAREPFEFVAARRPLAPGPHWYRTEFKDGGVRWFIDGVEIGFVPDGEFVYGEFIGLWSDRTPLVVRYFRVTLV